MNIPVGARRKLAVGLSRLGSGIVFLALRWGSLRMRQLFSLVFLLFLVPAASGLAQKGPAAGSAPLSQAELMVLLTNVLNDAGVQGYRLENPLRADDPAVIFTLADGSKGKLFAVRGAETWSADTYAGLAVGHMARLCQGQFSSGKQSVPSVDGSVIRKVLTTCQQGDATFVTERTIVRHANGLVIELTHIFRTDHTTARSDQERAAMVDAAMRVRDGR